MRAWPALLALAVALPVGAIDRIRIRAEQISTAGVSASEVELTLQVHSTTRSTLALCRAALPLPPGIAARAGALSRVELHCLNPVIREPLFACPRLQLRLHSSRFQAIPVDAAISLRSDTGRLVAKGTGPDIAGATLHFAIDGTAARLGATADFTALDLAAAAKLLAPYATLPADLAVSGKGELHVRLDKVGEALNTEVTARISAAGFQNADYTWIGEKLALTTRAGAELSRKPYRFNLKVFDTKGQALAGPVLLDFDKNPLVLDIAGTTDGTSLQITALRSQQQDLADVRGTANLTLAPLGVSQADITASNIRFPAAYSSYLQLLLATTPFNQLTATGMAEARIAISGNAPASIDFTLHDLAFSDRSRSLDVTGVNSELHWTAVRDATPAPSWLSWENSRGWGIVGAPTRLDFAVNGADFRLLKAARLPFFDGALRINTFAVADIGSEQMSGVFDAVIEPISVGQIARALGWPEFAGKLAGRIPGLTYNDRVLTLAGNVEADVFDGRIVASNLRVREPLGAWPRLFGDIAARNLDLDLITRTFEFGSITGRLDADMKGLETFNWSPVAFDLALATPARDRSRHRISQRAVQTLSDIGGGGGGVAAALQSGALKFFDDFGYDRLGLSCRLRNDVCQMGGAGKAGNGFYIVKGKGLPRIDIIGNNKRVDWPLLMQQVGEALANPDGIDVK
jgi:hypothetical protein